ncbi:ribosome maturation factor RimP [Anaerobacillus sp. CMMVII]|uniref:ribosome maturation factor RimP n=1 Tax=Anaerobacillus sp. CMMVII TaxID=2755588 RepID=UPI0021B727A3|nr:ribosome maturation factor RimP [Anaerobacillus sp. CMMVII]MCT8139855.1 ribosome maturation factor RimP [Anaerobacillus sp. CMMVII]
MSDKVTTIVEQLVTPIVSEMQLELVDVEFKKEGKNWFLRVYIDSESGVDIEDCGTVSERLSELLDEKDPIPQAYFLEVSSPGAERPLKKSADVEKAVGKNIYVTLYEPINGEKSYEGKLIAFDGVELTIATKQKTRVIEVVIPYEKVASARLAVVF